MILVYCNVDASGIVIDALVGEGIIPSKPYQYFYIVDRPEVYEIKFTLAQLETWQTELFSGGGA